ncbi:hypothetical protein GCM10011349_14980 [Novosphingobium indicum]|uniref:Uncharacterized protein n=1 Tax=Novosphingobium indicum TaxID=462949 RepID=A0ABQ2JHR1_9SPHN|nr:hypothetical protein [Novosphingobium indicum]GGN47120.1 hypothetical protein GCM10011349_14980 [Novosphingobium indicum]
MAEETVKTDSPAEPPTITHTTVIKEKSRGSGMGIIMAVLLLAVVIGAMYVFGMQSSSEDAKNNAIAQAASDVGNAASKVGDAAQSAAKKVNPD